MNQYKTILFDIDDTLFNFSKDQEIAFKNAMKEIGYECTDEMYTNYDNINREMWELLEKGKITLQELFVKRFEIFFKQYKIEHDPKEFDEILTLQFQKTATPIQGSKEVLEKISNKYELAIASNGPKNQQYHRLQKSDYQKYFSKIFISEEIGYNKPDTRFFNYVLSNLQNKDKSKVLIIGDSIISDIKGGIDAGIHTCWYNFKNKQATGGIKPTYEIKSLNEILDII